MNNMQVNNIDAVLGEYDSILATANREKILLTVYANEKLKEAETLSEECMTSSNLIKEKEREIQDLKLELEELRETVQELKNSKG